MTLLTTCTDTLSGPIAVSSITCRSFSIVHNLVPTSLTRVICTSAVIISVSPSSRWRFPQTFNRLLANRHTTSHIFYCSKVAISSSILTSLSASLSSFSQKVFWGRIFLKCRNIVSVKYNFLPLLIFKFRIMFKTNFTDITCRWILIITRVIMRRVYACITTACTTQIIRLSFIIFSRLHTAGLPGTCCASITPISIFRACTINVA